MCCARYPPAGRWPEKSAKKAHQAGLEPTAEGTCRRRGCPRVAPFIVFWKCGITCKQTIQIQSLNYFQNVWYRSARALRLGARTALRRPAPRVSSTGGRPGSRRGAVLGSLQATCGAPGERTKAFSVYQRPCAAGPCVWPRTAAGQAGGRVGPARPARGHDPVPRRGGFHRKKKRTQVENHRFGPLGTKIQADFCETGYFQENRGHTGGTRWC